MPTEQPKWLSEAPRPHLCTLGEKSTILRPHTHTEQNSLIKALSLVSKTHTHTHNAEENMQARAGKMIRNEQAAENKKDGKNIKIKTSQITWQFGGYLIQTWSDYISLISPQRFIITVSPLMITLLILGFQPKLNKLGKKNTTKLKILVVYL